MIKIMFVCYGNICRSPMAEFVFKSILEKNGKSGSVKVSSSATSTEEIGNSVYPNAKAELARHKISCNGKRAVQLKSVDGDEYDMFIGMDNDNIRRMREILGEDKSDKIYRLMDFTVRGGEVADPWYTRSFNVAYNDIYEGCTALYEKLVSEGKIK